MSKVNREIQVLNDAEHLLARPNIYVGAVEPQEEKTPIIQNGKLVSKLKIVSSGFYKILDEVLDNAFDEAKRCYSQNYMMKEISLSIDTKTNKAIVKDTGLGFHNGTNINKKSGLNNIETAVSMLRAGSNFSNNDTEATLIGTNGVGVSCTNVLSDLFEIKTSDGNYEYTHTWNKFVTVEKTQVEGNFKSGTTITFIPRKEIFKKQKWDAEIIITKLLFREFNKQTNEELKNVKISLEIDGKKIDLSKPIIPENAIMFENKHSKLYVWTDYTDATSISFVNGSLCTGIHQKLANEWINSNIFDNYEKAHYFYKTCVVLNLPPKKVIFGDQNKTKFIGTREDLQIIVNYKLTKKDFIDKLMNCSFYKDTLAKIQESLQKENINIIKKAKKERSKKISDKFFSSQAQDNIFLVEGNSAGGSLNQVRNPKVDAIYTLRGKLKNAKTIQDLSENTEIVDLMNILNLEINDKGTNCKWKKIIIAVDFDPDGIGHIASLIIQLFYKWFPDIINKGKLFILSTPLVSTDTSKGVREYYYSLDDFSKSNAANKKNVRYLKGLGSLSVQDWNYVFANMNLYRVIIDGNSERSMNIAFGESVLLRKKWLAK